MCVCVCVCVCVGMGVGVCDSCPFLRMLILQLNLLMRLLSDVPYLLRLCTMHIYV